MRAGYSAQSRLPLSASCRNLSVMSERPAASLNKPDAASVLKDWRTYGQIFSGDICLVRKFSLWNSKQRNARRYFVRVRKIRIETKMPGWRIVIGVHRGRVEPGGITELVRSHLAAPQPNDGSIKPEIFTSPIFQQPRQIVNATAEGGAAGAGGRHGAGDDRGVDGGAFSGAVVGITRGIDGGKTDGI